MPTRRLLLTSLILGAVGIRLFTGSGTAATAADFPLNHAPEEWKKLLTPQQYSVLREEGTERPFTSPLLDEHRSGRFACAACDQAAFDSATKYDSGTGWPSFWQPLDGAIGTSRDTSLFGVRTEVHCSNCGGHFGHVFTDGPQPTGLRYCMNGVALQFHPAAA